MSQAGTLDIDFVRKQFPGLKTDWALFDNAGGSQIVHNALDYINRFLTEKNVQIGGSYQRSLDAAAAMQDAREAGRLLVNAARPEEIVFGASTTAHLQNLARAMRSQLKPGDEIVVSYGDHESNIGPWVGLQEFGIKLRNWPVNKQSLALELDDLRPLLNERTKLVSIHHVSNILGAVNPVAEIAELVHEHGARLCVDAVAYAPHRAIDVRAWDVDYYVFSLYKTYGPHYAIMYGKYDHLAELDTLYHYFYGKEKVPTKLEPGNAIYELAYATCGIVDYLTTLGGQVGGGGGKRAKIEAAFSAIAAREVQFVNRLLSYLRTRNDCRIVGPTVTREELRIPTISFKFDSHDSGDVARALEQHKVAIRFGDFHSKRLIEDLDMVPGSGVVRASLVHYNTFEEIDRLIDGLQQMR